MIKIYDPCHLDVKAFAVAAAELSGEGPVAQWPRLLGEQWAPAGALLGRVHWHVQGRMIAVAGAEPQPGLRLKAEVDLTLQCQRCLTAVVAPVTAQRDFLFVADEATAEALDEESEDDVLAISRDFDVLSLIEDELILALPLVPRHEVCPQNLLPAMADPDAAERPHPFAALAALKKKG